MARDLSTAIAFVVFAFAFAPSSYAQQLQLPQIPTDPIPAAAAPFSPPLKELKRVALATGKRIVITDSSGVLREGVLEETTFEGVTLRTESARQSFKWAEVASADRVKDESADGAAKGALFAALFGGFNATFGQYLGGIAVYAFIGYLIDEGEVNRQPIYRTAMPSLHEARPSSAPTVSFRFRF